MSARDAQRERVLKSMALIQRMVAVREKLGLSPVTAAKMRQSFPSLDQVEAIAPGLIATVVAAAHGDADASHKLEAIIASPDGPQSVQ